jgi:hypothetical protein
MSGVPLVGITPTTVGFWGSVTSTKPVLLLVAMSAYSRPVCGSVQPQMSLPVAPPSIGSGTAPARSTFLHG